MICITLCACAIAVLHEQWMCLGMQRNTHITGNNLIPISVPIHLWMAVTCIIYNIGVFSSGDYPIDYEGEDRDGYRDQIVTCDVGVSLHSKTHPLFMKYSKHTVLSIRACFLCFFYNPYMSLFNSKNFSFTCLHSFINCMFITPPPNKN